MAAFFVLVSTVYAVAHNHEEHEDHEEYEHHEEDLDHQCIVCAAIAVNDAKVAASEPYLFHFHLFMSGFEPREGLPPPVMRLFLQTLRELLLVDCFSKQNAPISAQQERDIYGYPDEYSGKSRE